MSVPTVMQSSLTVLTITRTGGTVPFAVNFATSNGTAVAGDILVGDYLQAAGTLTFAAGENTKSIALGVWGDSTVEPDETFFVNLSGITNRTADETELWDTWIVGAPIAGQNVSSVLTVAVIDDLDHNGVYDDAPDVIADVNHDGRINAADLHAIGVASNVVTIPFRINGDSV